MSQRVKCLLAAALLLCPLLAACEKAPAPEQETPVSSQTTPEAPPREDVEDDIILEPIDEEPEAPETAVTGSLLPLGAPEFEGFPDGVLASGEELARWQELTEPGAIASVLVCDMGEEGRELTASSAAQVVKTLENAQLGLYETLGNPITGGSFFVGAYDASGALLFRAAYNGEWLTVQFDGEGEGYIFDGSAAGLDKLYTCTAE